MKNSDFGKTVEGWNNDPYNTPSSRDLVKTDNFHAPWREYGYASRLQYLRGGASGYRFSDDNPYARQMLYESDRQRLFDLQAKAIEWQANNQATQQQRDWQLEDRDYNSPENQARLMREAGINPDLGDSVQFNPASEQPGKTDSASPVDDSGESDKATERASAVVGTVGNVASIAMQCLSFVNQSMNLGNQYRSGQLQNTGLDLRNQSLQQDIKYRDTANQYALDRANMDNTVYSNAMTADAVKALLSRVDENGDAVPVTDADKEAYLATLPESQRDSAGSSWDTYLGNSALLDSAISQRRSLQFSRAMNTYEAQHNYIAQYVDLYHQNELMQMRMSYNMSKVQNSINDLLLQDPDYAKAVASSMKSDAVTNTSNNELQKANNDAQIQFGLPSSRASAQASTLKFSTARVKEHYKQFFRSMDVLKAKRADLVARYNSIRNKKGNYSEQDVSTMYSLLTSIHQIDVSGVSNLGNAYQAIRDGYMTYTSWHSSRNFYEGSPENQSKNGGIMPSNWSDKYGNPTKEDDILFNNMSWNQYLSSNNASSEALEQILAFLSLFK